MSEKKSDMLTIAASKSEGIWITEAEIYKDVSWYLSAR